MRKKRSRSIRIAIVAVGAILAGCALPPRPAAPASGSSAGPAPAPQSPLHPFVYYIPNRIVDVFDVFSLGVALPSIPQLFPSTVHVNAHVTRAIQVGAGTTHGTFLGKGYHRRFAWGLYHDELSAGPLTVAHLRFEPAASGPQDGTVDRVGMLFPEDPPFAMGYMDYWALGAHVGLLPVALSVDIHPVEVADALLGFFLIDICRDDY